MMEKVMNEKANAYFCDQLTLALKELVFAIGAKTDELEPGMYKDIDFSKLVGPVYWIKLLAENLRFYYQLKDLNFPQDDNVLRGIVKYCDLFNEKRVTGDTEGTIENLLQIRGNLRLFLQVPLFKFK